MVISVTVIMIIVYILIVGGTTLIYRNYNKKFLNEYKSNMDKQLEDHKKELSRQNQIFTNQLENVVQTQQEYMQAHKHMEKELFSTFVKIKKAIKADCYNVANEISAGRLAIYLFHNGSTSTHGIDFVKMSCVCEKVAVGSGVKERLMEHSNIPINLFDDMVEHLVEHSKYIVLNDTNTCSETTIKLFISSPKVKYTQLVSIFDQENNLLGFVCAEMLTSYSREQALIEEQAIIKLIVSIRPILTYSEYTNVTLNNPSSTIVVQHD